MNRLANASLSLGDVHLAFPIRPYSAQWAYQANTSSTDTLGGRVVQLLSVQVTELQVQSVAGSRRELQRIADGIRELMQRHIVTSQPAYFKVPSRKWNFRVYVSAMPQMGWDVASTSYPYSLAMAIHEELNGVKSDQIRRTELARLSDGIGYDPKVHGGDVGGFTKTVESILAAKASQSGGAGSSGGNPDFDPSTSKGANVAPPPERFQGDHRFPGKAANAPWEGQTVSDAVYNAWEYAAGASVAKVMLCIVNRESGWDSAANNGLPPPPLNTNGSWDLGLHQLNTVFAGRSRSQGWNVTSTQVTPLSWWPVDDYRQMFDPEYNTRAAIDVWQRGGLAPWGGSC